MADIFLTTKNLKKFLQRKNFETLSQKARVFFGRKDESFGQFVDFLTQMSYKMSYTFCTKPQKAEICRKNVKKCLTNRPERGIIYKLSARRAHHGSGFEKLF